MSEKWVDEVRFLNKNAKKPLKIQKTAKKCPNTLDKPKNALYKGLEIMFYR